MARSTNDYTTTGARNGAARCKPKTCPRCGGQECIERPRFFCGQLLTDKDLDAAQRYVIAKNRLHNRYLVGKGVVCGLAVRCAPCDEESVLVEPGYAIDCCGNDVVVCEPATFNVKEYIDACFGPKQPDCDGPVRARPMRCDDKGPKEFCLFLSYSEEAARPVTTLIRDKGCQSSRCEPSRVRETFRLDLVEKGSLPKGRPPDLWSRLRECLPAAGKQMGRAAAQFYALDFQNQGAREFYQRDLLRSSHRAVAELYRRGPDIRCNVEDLFCGDCPTVAVKSAEFVEPGKPTLFEAVVTGGDPAVTPTFTWEVSTGAAFSGQGTPSISVPPSAALVDITATVTVGGYAASCATTASGTSKVNPQVILDRSPGANVAAPAETITPSAALQQRDTEVLAEVLTPYFQYMIDCFCDALLVPCAPCEEPEGVLLACITVEGGKVVSICNVARTQLITGPALRYWLGPLFTGTHSLLERLCCRFEVSRYKRFVPSIYRGVSKVFGAAKSKVSGLKPAGASSYREAFARARTVVGSTARVAAGVARAKLGDFQNLRHVADPSTALGAEFYRLDTEEAKARLSKMSVNVVEERVAATPEEANTLTNLRSMVDVVRPGAAVVIVKDAQNRVVAVRARAAAEEGAGGEVKG